MARRTLILHVPVLHAGYLALLERAHDNLDAIYLIDDVLAESLSNIKPDLASLPAQQMERLCASLGLPGIQIFHKEQAEELKDKPLILVNDRVSRELGKRFFSGADIVWESVFLRWDEDSVHTADTNTFAESSSLGDKKYMQMAYEEASRSSDWWRHVGAVLVRDGVILAAAHNEGMPSDHTPYQRGAVRDFLLPGEKPELVDAIHAEQKLIADAARTGVPLAGAHLYVTHFPCPVCAKLILTSGITVCYFSEGWSTLQSATLLERAGVSLIRVPQK